MKTFFVLFLLPSFLFAKSKEAPYLKVTKVKPAAMRQGKTGDAVVTVTIGVGLHIQANPAAQPNLIPTEIKLDAKDGFEFGSPTYPPGKVYRLQNSNRDLSTYDGTIEIKVPITASVNTKAGKEELKGKLRFQPCNDKICFFPTSVPVTIPVTVYK